MNKQDFDWLVDRNEIAHILGVGPTAVSNYVAQTNKKHPPFPEPVVSRSMGRFRLWDITEVEAWHTSVFSNRAHLWENATEEIEKFRESYNSE